MARSQLIEKASRDGLEGTLQSVHGGNGEQISAFGDDRARNDRPMLGFQSLPVLNYAFVPPLWRK
jgi:hypothetical protein